MNGLIIVPEPLYADPWHPTEDEINKAIKRAEGVEKSTEADWAFYEHGATDVVILARALIAHQHALQELREAGLEADQTRSRLHSMPIAQRWGGPEAIEHAERVNRLQVASDVAQSVLGAADDTEEEWTYDQS